MKIIFSLVLAALLCSAPVLAEDPQVILKTSHGDITVRLYAEQAPLTVANFLAYVDSGFYRDTIFHRVIPGFMIQGGGFTENMQDKPSAEPIVNESRNRLHNERGTLAMARSSEPNSATSQFYINVRNNFSLDWTPGSPGYAVFGDVIDGMYTVDSIALEATGAMLGHEDVPIKPVKILDVVRVAQE